MDRDSKLSPRWTRHGRIRHMRDNAPQAHSSLVKCWMRVAWNPSSNGPLHMDMAGYAGPLRGTRPVCIIQCIFGTSAIKPDLSIRHERTASGPGRPFARGGRQAGREAGQGHRDAKPSLASTGWRVLVAANRGTARRGIYIYIYIYMSQLQGPVA